jgi:hypothetical protein
LVNSIARNKELEMDTIKFVIEQYTNEEFGYTLPVINIYINDRDLIDLISAVEHKLFVADGEKVVRSNYIGYEVEHFERFRNEMLGRKTYPHSVLLTCACTIAECNCIMADITIEEQTVIWSDLRSPWFGGKTPSPFIDWAEAQSLGWQPLDYSELGPFVFDRGQYLSALDKVTQEARLQKP